MADEEVNGSVRYTAKELFEKIDGKLDSIDAKLDDKIGRQEFEELKVRVSMAEGANEALNTKLVKYGAIGSTLLSGVVIAANYFLH